MFTGRWWLVAGMVLLVASAGCCRFCDRWCGPKSQPVPVAPYAPAYAPAPAAAPCCVPCIPCCPTSQIKQPVPAYSAHAQGTWQRSYYIPDNSCCN